MLDTKKYRVWIQKDLNKKLKDPSTEVYDLSLSLAEQNGLYATLLALGDTVKATIHEIKPNHDKLFSFEDGYWGFTIGDWAYYVCNPDDLKSKSYVDCILHRNPYPVGDTEHLFTLIQNPVHGNKIIIPCYTLRPVFGIDRLFTLLGYDSSKYILGVQDAHGNKVQL